MRGSRALDNTSSLSGAHTAPGFTTPNTHPTLVNTPDRPLVDIRDDGGFTPLIYAACLDNVEAIKVLMLLDADPKFISWRGGPQDDIT